MPTCAYCESEIAPGDGVWELGGGRVFCDKTCQRRYALLGSRS